MGCANSVPATFLDIKDGEHDAPENTTQITKIYYFEDVWGRKSVLEFMLDKAGIPFEVVRISAVGYYSGI